MPYLQTGIDWIDNLHLRTMPQKESRNLTVTVDGDERDATWKHL